MLLSAFGTKILIYSDVKRSQAFETATNLLASRLGRNRYFGLQVKVESEIWP